MKLIALVFGGLFLICLAESSRRLSMNEPLSGLAHLTAFNVAAFVTLFAEGVREAKERSMDGMMELVYDFMRWLGMAMMLGVVVTYVMSGGS